jgi:heterodisulfide reductase subunit B
MPAKKLEVSLISIPENMLDTIYTACRTCYSADGAVEIYKNITSDNGKYPLCLMLLPADKGGYSHCLTD